MTVSSHLRLVNDQDIIDTPFELCLSSKYQPVFKSSIHKYNFYRDTLISYGWSYKELFGKKMHELIELYIDHNTMLYAPKRKRDKVIDFFLKIESKFMQFVRFV